MANVQLNPTELAIVQFLFEHAHDYQSSKVLASQMAVSDKTVRKYIRELESVLAAYGASIEMKKGSGYRLIVEDNQVFYQLIEAIRDQRHQFEDSSLLADNQDRERYLLNAILLENRQVTIEDLAEQLYISKSTVSTVVQIIKNRIRKYALNIAYDADGYIQVVGQEVDKRRFILNYFFAPKSVDSLNADLIDYKFDGFSTETIFIIVLEKCREFEVRLSDYVLQNLVLHIALAIKRNEKGFVINKTFDDQQLEYSKELFVAEKIVNSIESLIDIKFPEDEAKYIALHLKSKANRLDTSVAKTDSGTDSVAGAEIGTNQPASSVASPMQALNQTSLTLEKQLTLALMVMQEQGDIQFNLDQQLLMGLMVHFEPLLTRLKTGISLQNPLYDELTTKYPEVLTATKKGMQNLQVLQDYEVNNHEWAYISLHMLAACERYKNDHKVNAIVICATGLGSAQMLKSRLEHEFAANLVIVDVISYYQLKDEMLTDIDLIISTIDISTSFYNIPVVKVSVFLNKQDIEALNLHIERQGRGIESSGMKRGPETTQSLSAISKHTPSIQDELENIFNRYLSPERFIIIGDTDATSGVVELSETNEVAETNTANNKQPISEPTRQTVLAQLIEKLSDPRHNLTFVTDLLNQIEIRERFGSVAFTKRVAFPHPAQPVGLTSEIVVGLIPGGMQWDAEHREIQMVILMSHSKIENKGLDVINSGLAELIKHEEKVTAILEQPTFDNFKQIFMEIVRD